MITTCAKLIVISFSSLQSGCCYLYGYFTLYCETILLRMPSLNRNDKVTCANCGLQTTLFNPAHQKRCSVGQFYFAKCPKFSTGSQADLNFHMQKSIGFPSQRKFTTVNFAIKCLLASIPRD